MKKIIGIIIGLILLVGILILAGYLLANKTGFLILNPTNDVIDIGVMFPLSGDAASIGIEGQNAVNLAVNEINNNGGINNKKLKLIYEDSKCDPKEAVTAIQKLINIDQTKLIIGEMCSGATLAAAPIAEQNKVILISPFSTSPDVTNAGDYIFRTAPSDALQGSKIADYALNQKIQTIGIIVEETDYAEALNRVFKEKYLANGGKVVAEEKYTTEDNDMKTLIAKIKDKESQAIYIIPQTPAKLGLILKQIKELNYTGIILTTEMADSQDLFRDYSKELDGIVFAQAKFNKDLGKSKEFLDKYKATYGDYPKTFGLFFFAAAYDTPYLLKDAIEKCKAVNPDCIKTQLYSIKNREGAAGIMTINQYGDAEFDYEIKTIKNGVVTNIE